MKRIIYLLAALPILWLGACSQDDVSIDNGDPVAVNFSAAIAGAAVDASKNATGFMMSTAPSKRIYTDYIDSDGFPTRVFYPRTTASDNLKVRTSSGGDEWEQNDGVGIFMLTTGGTVTSGSDRLADNIKYNATPGTPASDATFAPASLSETIYYPQSGSVDFVAYYPHAAKGTGTGQVNGSTYMYKISVADQTDPAKIDVLYAEASNIAKSKTAVNLTFSHKLAKITLDVKAGDGFTATDIQSLAATAVKFGAMPLTAELKLQDGTLTADPAGADFSPLKAATATTGYNATFSAVLVPQAASTYTGRTVVFSIGGQNYTWQIPDTEVFAAGSQYIYPVTVKKNGIDVGAPTITNWITNSNGTVAVSPLPVETVLIKAGTFIMGSPVSEPGGGYNETQHEVTLTKDFWMSKYPITFAQYDTFCDATVRSKPSDNGWGRGNRPVINVSWNDAAAYCAWLSGQTGLTCTLPTEAQWEYACRGSYANKASEWNTQPFGIGDGTKLIYGMANYNMSIGSYALPGGPFLDNINLPLNQTSPVGSYQPNNYGLYDMHGNVAEWCADWFAANYGSVNASDAVTDPVGPGSGISRSFRSSAWAAPAEFCRSAHRLGADPNSSNITIGFRVVFVP